MIDNWWIDLVALILLLVLGYVLYMAETTGIGQPDLDEQETLPTDDSPEGLRIYPATLIRQCGYRPDQVRLLYWTAKLMLALVMPLIAVELVLGQLPIWMVVLSALGGFFIPELWLLARRRKRRSDISGSLSFFINLMVVYLQTGMNLTQAFRQAAAYGLTPTNPLAEEVELLTREIEAGRDRDTAFAMLAKRTGVLAVKQLASVISVGFRAGSPITETLRGQADLLKARQSQMATELVNRRSMEAMLPMLLICFPVFLVLVLFPAVLQMSDVLKMIGELF